MKVPAHICEYCGSVCECNNIECSHREEFTDNPSQCDICGLTDDHSLECPNDNSPFANLLIDGFD